MNLNKRRKNLIGNILFISVFVGLFFIFGLNEKMFYPPQSVHLWRQTNCTSLTQNYFQYDLPFFKPEMHNQLCEGGYSGKAVGEFPIIYYFVAQLWKTFGKHEWIFKLVQITILFLGLFSLFLCSKRLLKNQFWAGFLSLLIFTSPMVVFYGPNFLPDVPALSFVFLAWYFALRFTENRKAIHLWISAMLFCMAMLLKITSVISFVALGGWVVFELLFQEKEDRIFRFSLKHFFPFLLILLPVLAWYWYADYYNSIYRGHISYHGIWPVWEMTAEQFNRIIDALEKVYLKELFLPFTQYLTIAIWLYLVLTIKKMKPVYRYFVIILPAGFLVQLLLWFQVLEGHDYYMINLLIVFVFIWAIFLMHINKLKLPYKYIAHVLAVIFFVCNVYTCHQQAKIRYEGWMNEMFDKNLKALIDIQPTFQKWGIHEEDKVISIPDFTINGSLYLMNRKGYTDFGSDFSKAETFYKRIEQGAKYLVVNDSTVFSREYLKPFLQNKVGEFENISVFNIENIRAEN